MGRKSKFCKEVKIKACIELDIFATITKNRSYSKDCKLLE